MVPLNMEALWQRGGGTSAAQKWRIQEGVGVRVWGLSAVLCGRRCGFSSRICRLNCSLLWLPWLLGCNCLPVKFSTQQLTRGGGRCLDLSLARQRNCCFRAGWGSLGRRRRPSYPDTRSPSQRSPSEVAVPFFHPLPPTLLQRSPLGHDTHKCTARQKHGEALLSRPLPAGGNGMLMKAFQAYCWRLAVSSRCSERVGFGLKGAHFVEVVHRLRLTLFIVDLFMFPGSGIFTKSTVSNFRDMFIVVSLWPPVFVSPLDASPHNLLWMFFLCVLCAFRFIYSCCTSSRLADYQRRRRL